MGGWWRMEICAYYLECEPPPPFSAFTLSAVSHIFFSPKGEKEKKRRRSEGAISKGLITARFEFQKVEESREVTESRSGKCLPLGFPLFFLGCQIRENRSRAQRFFSTFVSFLFLSGWEKESAWDGGNIE